MRIRKVKSKSGNTVVQVGHYQDKKFILYKHIGSAKNSIDLEKLISIATELIEQDKTPLFKTTKQQNNLINTNKLKPLGYTRNYAYKSLELYYQKIFTLPDSILKDLSILRLIKPTSKLEAVEYLREYFGINYSKSNLHRKLGQVTKLETEVFESVISYAKKHFDFKFQFLFYDVTTLYFETHLQEEDKAKPEEIRKYGFSKDKRNDLPQILIGLVVDANGFPIYYQIFEGDKFEGHTILPVILEFKTKFKVKELTIVADSGMLSKENLLQLDQAGLSYIVGGRVKNESIATLNSINQELNGSDNQTTTRQFSSERIVYQFSKKRHQKDKYEYEKQLKKATEIIENPSKAKKKLKFITTKNQVIQFNQTMVEKAKLSMGIKSYVTNNHNLDANQIIDTYHNLWQVEKAFRMSKSDLEIRPVFHRKKESIHAHILIVFVSLVVAKVIEIDTGISIKRYVNEITKVLEFSLLDEISGEIITFQTRPQNGD
jgi:transposase